MPRADDIIDAPPPMLLALHEPGATALLLAVFGLLMAFSALFSRLLDRMGVPVVLLFLVLGMLGGSEGIGGLHFENYEAAFRIGTIALILILFDGGLNTSFLSVKRSAAPAAVLATLGVLGTAAALAVIARLAGLTWTEAILIGAIVSSTDAAAVFAVLRGGSLRVKEHVRSLLEVESCANDPMAIILTFAAVAAVDGGLRGAGGWWLLADVPLQLGIGLAVGLGLAYATRFVLKHSRFTATGLYPVITLASAFVIFGTATMMNGSGFLAVYVAGLVLGNGPLPHRNGLARVHDALAWLSQVSMFLMLGLLVTPSDLPGIFWIGTIVALGLAIVARPAVVAACLVPFGFKPREIGYVSWVGIRGAVPIILATVPVMAGIPGAERIFHVVFFIVVISAIVPGATIVPLTRKLKLDDPEPTPPAAALELHSLRPLDGVIHVYRIDATLAVCGVPLAKITFPEGSAAIMISRGNEVMAARGHTVLEVGDHVYIFCKPGDEPRIRLLFGADVDSGEI
ncbi:MAG TPA: potassium/proton antiporter [Phycisphaerales bacterium]|nr:potassium/proton antiporter [Phycisphaerales bacterium]HMP37071.1 potassium/proton antiporter [Phycisphaerales bacterium]